MNKFTQFIPFALLTIGTLGLLIGEFFIDLGRKATLTFAVFNIVGLVFLYYRLRNFVKPPG
jgi:energy-converting hydrogenase Eha subunit C